MYQCYCI